MEDVAVVKALCDDTLTKKLSEFLTELWGHMDDNVRVHLSSPF